MQTIIQRDLLYCVTGEFEILSDWFFVFQGRSNIKMSPSRDENDFGPDWKKKKIRFGIIYCQKEGLRTPICVCARVIFCILYNIKRL